MEFQVRLRYKDGVRLDPETVAKSSAEFGDLMVGPDATGRSRAELLDGDGWPLLPTLYEPVVTRVTAKYMEISGTNQDGHPQSWVLRFFPIEATKEWAEQFPGRGIDMNNTSMGHLQSMPPASWKK